MPSLSTIPATNPYIQCPNYLSPDSPGLPSTPIKFEHTYRPALSDLNDDSCSNYTTSYGSDSGLYYIGSSQSSYSPRSAAFPSPLLSYSDANTALLNAIRLDDEAMLCQILGNCSQASTYAALTPNGDTPIHVAVTNRSSAVLPRLLLAPDSANTLDPHGNTPLHRLFGLPCWWREEKLLAMLQELLCKTDVNIRNRLGESSFDIAFAQLRSLGLQGSPERAAPNVNLGLAAAAADDAFALGIVMTTIVDRLIGSKTAYSSVQRDGWQRATECLCTLLEAGAHPDSLLGDAPVLSSLLSRPAAETEAFGRLYEFTCRLAGLADAAAPDAQGLTALDYAISARPQEGIAARQRQVIHRLTERCRLADRHGIRRASTGPSSLVAFAAQWGADEGFLELSMRLVAARADTSALIHAPYRESFPEDLRYLVSISQAGDGDERAARDPYGLEPRARLDNLQSEVAPRVPLGAAIWISACDLDSWDTAREYLRALEKLMPKPPCPTRRLHDEALRLLSTKFLDCWATQLRAAASSLHYALPDPSTRQVADRYLGVLNLCIARGEHAMPEKRHHDLVTELPAFFAPAADGRHSAYART